MLPAGIEPATFHLGGERSIQLSYGSKSLYNFFRVPCFKNRISLKIERHNR